MKGIRSNEKSFGILTIILVTISLSSCGFFSTNKGATERFTVSYLDESIDKDSLDAYFLNNEDLYPSYTTLKANTPTLLDNVRAINTGEYFSKTIQLMRFSFNGNGFLEGATFMKKNEHYYPIGVSFGGYGVTEFVRRQGNAGHWLYYLYSSGSGIHRTEIGVFDLIKNETCRLSELALEQGKDYTFIVDESDNTIDLYEASIHSSLSNDGFDTYDIVRGELAFANIDDMKIEY